MSMEKLLMHVALVDQVTKPLQGITKEVQSSMEAGKQGMQNMATGGAGLVATGFAIQNALMPAIEMDRKLGEVKSLGVTDDALKQLQATALDFAAEYGKSATEFVGASYDIQSAIAGLSGDELSQFTKASGVLAAATKADTATITSYMGTMYGIFKNQATEMGKGEWVEQVAGMTASAVQMFKTTGSEMSSAFTSVGANATSAGIAMYEQMAILGTLQATMSGSEAGTKYKAFLAGVANAQDKLNLSFTDSQGQMLPMLDILDQLKGKYGDTLSVAESADLKKAFGSEEAVSMIKLLMADTDGLAGSIEQLGQVQGMSKAEEMASAMTDQWERLEASWFAVRAAVFGAILPSINAIVGSMANGLVYITGWTDEFPWLAEILGYVAIAGLSLGGVVATLSLAMGIGQMMSAGWAVTMTGLNSIMKLLRITTIASTAAAWLFNAALWANPITWVVAGIALLIGGVAAAIYWWDDLTAAFKDTAWFNVIAGAIEGIVDLLNMIPGVDIELGSKVDTPEVSAAVQAERNAPTSIQPMAFDAPEMPTGNGGSIAEYKQPGAMPTLPPGMVQNVTTTHKPQGGNMNSYGDVYITAPNGITPDQLAEWDELNAG
ncbi:phage tail tape measure protein [Vibrio sp. 10N.261.46.E12]|uniref:phage tail tape measure protein n=1 Tax=unclassified Vibrio TaxID=2614977 RepID=UPI000976E000|nr:MULTISPECIES: phage tail tape measure protein [unclassified Vibrio]OMO36285.1 phage tail tape measure protein [Vibrio sp. 10N.261.45.E1]PMJ23358.1 phage tail tape measure protein [Vibrio sp. 10N.286.45.B6]PML95106.1 phage tail tape measure protein [Vibrio sp. 10N.261.49.E11]PMM67150.1 phage tail tape measure protein [Vibrio sp. 10N.261.46.F12]PMM79982.1 phage tail tape measure protein [Vibrio sp. 10N.261.46.E8]